MWEISVSRDISTVTSTTSPRSRTPARRRIAVRRSGAACGGTDITRAWYDTPPGKGDHVNIRPNRVKQKLAAGKIATILAGTNDPDLIDQLGPLDVDGIWLEGEHGGVDYADLGNLTRAWDLWGMTSIVRVRDSDYATIYRPLGRGAQGDGLPSVHKRLEPG